MGGIFLDGCCLLLDLAFAQFLDGSGGGADDASCTTTKSVESLPVFLCRTADPHTRPERHAAFHHSSVEGAKSFNFNPELVQAA